MSYLYNRISPRREKVLKVPLFPLDVECRVSGFDDEPNEEYIGHFRKIENHSVILFQYGKLFRIAHLDYLGNLVVVITATEELWEFYLPPEKRRIFFTGS